MSFRGRYPTRFKRSVSKRQFVSERGRPFKMRYQEERGLSFKSRNVHNYPFYRRDYDKDYYHSKKGRGKDRQALGGRYLRPPKSSFSRGRYMHRDHNKRDRSSRHFQKRGNERSETIDPHEWSDEEQFCVLSEAERSHYSGSLIEWLGSNDGEFIDQEEYFERRSRSPIIRERFDTFSLQGSHERTFDRRSLSPLVIQTSFEKDFSNNHRTFHERRKSPSIRSRSFERNSRRSVSLEKRCRSRLRRSGSFRGNDYLSELEGSPASVHRRRSHERRRSVSNEARRCFSPISRSRKSRSPIRRSRRSKRSLDKYSLSSIEREIQYEKRRFQMLQHQKKFHEKRSESSIERFLDDCKRSIEKKSKSSDKSNCRQEKHDRSLTPERPRRFKGLDQITIERGRSFEKSPQPHNMLEEGSQELSSISQPESFESREILKDSKILKNKFELSPISQPGSFEKNEFSQMNKRLDLSPISQAESYKIQENFEKILEMSPISDPRVIGKNKLSKERSVSADLRLSLSPISQPGTFERMEFSKKDNTAFKELSNLSPISQDGSFEKQKVDCITDRPNSTDSMQQFLAELEESCERSRSSSARSRSSSPGFKNNITRDTYEEHNRYEGSTNKNFEISYDKYFGGYKRVHDNKHSSAQKSPKARSLDRIPYYGLSDDLSSGFEKKSKTSQNDIGYEPMIKQMGVSDMRNEPFNAYSHQFSDVSRLNDNKSAFSGKQDHPNVKQFNYNEQGAFHSESINKAASHLTVQQSQIFNVSAFLGGSNQQSSSHQVQEESNINRGRELVDEKLKTSTRDVYLLDRLETSNQNIQLPNQIMDRFGIQNNNAPAQQFNQMSGELNQNSDLISRLINQFSSGKHGNTQIMETCRNITKNQEFQVILQETQKTYSIPSFDRSNQFELQNQLCGRPNSNIFNQELYHRRNQNVQFQQGLYNQYKTVPYDRQNVQHTDSSNQGHFERFFRSPIDPFSPQALGSQNKTMTFYSSIERSKQFAPFNQCNSVQKEKFFDFTAGQSSNQNLQSNSFLDRPSHYPFTHIGPEKYSDMALNNQFSEVQNISAEINENHQSQQSSVFGGDSRLVQNVPYKQGFDRMDSFQLLGGSERLNQDVSSEERSTRGQHAHWAARGVSNNQSQTLNAPVDIKHYLNTTFGSRAPTLLPKNKQNVEEVANGNVQLENQQNNFSKHLSNVLHDPLMSERYKDFPPSPEELGKMLKGFVIYFGVKSNSDLEKDPFVVIQESFSKSDRFGSLEVEEREYQEFQCDLKQICVLRWQGVMLVHAEGATREEARHNAAISLINSLAHTCYTVQAKYSYYCGGKLPLFMLRDKEKPGIYKIISRDELIKSVTDQLKLLRGQGVYVGRGVDATSIQVALNVLEEFFSKNSSSHCELLFGAKNNSQYSLFEHKQIFSHVDNLPELQVRSVRGFGRGVYSAVSRRFTPQQLCSYLLDYGQDHLRYRLIPPQGPQIQLLLPDAQYSPDIVRSVFKTSETAPHTQSQVQPSLRSGSFRGGRGYRGNAKRGLLK